MNKTETKVENIDGKQIEFHISYELKNQKNISAHLKVKNNSEFRDFEDRSKIIKCFLFNYLFTEIGEYFLLKASTIDENDEFQGTFEIQKFINIPNKFIRNVKLQLSDEEVNVDLEIKSEFQTCEYYKQSPFNNGDAVSFFNPIIDIYKDVVLIGKIRNEEDQIKVSNIHNSGESIIYKCFHEFINEYFGEAFKFESISQRSCSHFEVQIKYKIVPSIYKS